MVMSTCELQTFGNVIVMILAAIFTGIRMSRCTLVKTICFTCERDVMDKVEKMDSIESLPL